MNSRIRGWTQVTHEYNHENYFVLKEEILLIFWRFLSLKSQGSRAARNINLSFLTSPRNWIITIIIIFSSNIFLRICVSFLQLIDYLLSGNIKSWSNLDWFSVPNPSKLKKPSFSMPSLIDIIILSLFLFHVLPVSWTRINHGK